MEVIDFGLKAERTHLSEKAPAENDPMRTPPMNTVDTNCTRKLHPHTKLY